MHATAWGPHARWQLRWVPLPGTGPSPKQAGKKAKGEAAPPPALVGMQQLPPAPGTLRECGVKERLVARWREVRQVRGRTGVEQPGAWVELEQGAMGRKLIGA